MNGFNFQEFDEMIKNVEALGADMDRVSKRVLDAGVGPVKQVFSKRVPYDVTTPAKWRRHGHARDNISASRTKKSKKGSKYRVVEAHEGNLKYLWFIENGTDRIIARHYMGQIYDAARTAAEGPMRKALLDETNKHL